MLTTPKKSTHKSMMEEAYASPPSKRDTEKTNKYLSKEQAINSSNMKKNPFINHFDNAGKKNLFGGVENSKSKKENIHIHSAIKSQNGYSFAQTPNIQKNFTSSDKVPQQRLFTLQINKYNLTSEFDHSTPKKANNYKKTLFSSDSQESSNERENDSNTNSNSTQQNKENNLKKKLISQNSHIFASNSAIPAQKTKNFNNHIHQSARKGNPFLTSDFFGSKSGNGVVTIPFDRENRQMNEAAHQRDIKKTPQNSNKSNLLCPPSPSEMAKMSGRQMLDFKQSPLVTCFSSKTKKSANKFNKVSNNSSNSDSCNDQTNNISCSSFSISSGSVGQNQINLTSSNSILNHTPTKNNPNHHATKKANPKMLFEEDGDRFEQDYEILQVLGSGCFGTVYKCQNKIDKNIYAVKVTKEQIRGENSQKQILKEAQALASLSACDEVEYIVCYHSAWIEDRQLHLAMEFCDSNLANFALPQPNNSTHFYAAIKKIFSDVVKGLHYLHSQNLVHLDLKPENILYNKKQNKFKIADLGLALIANKDHDKYNQIEEGDARYLAKEILNYYEAIDLKKADIFSLGAMMYHLVTQEKLPSNGDEWLTIRQGTLPTLDTLTSCPKELKQMIKQMMNPDPELRLSTQEILDSVYMKSHLVNEIKWQKILKNLLINSIQKFEKDQQKQPIKRRNSLIIQKQNHFL